MRAHPRYEGALQITAARIFESREYLTDDTSVSAGMSREIETQIQLDVLAPDEAAVSFEFKFF